MPCRRLRRPRRGLSARGFFASSAVSRRLLILGGCAPAPRAESGCSPATVVIVPTGGVLGSSTAMGSPCAASAAPPRSPAPGTDRGRARRPDRARPAPPGTGCSGLFASSAVARRVLLLDGCDPAARPRSWRSPATGRFLSTGSVLGSSTSMASSWRASAAPPRCPAPGTDRDRFRPRGRRRRPAGHGLVGASSLRRRCHDACCFSTGTSRR